MGMFNAKDERRTSPGLAGVPPLVKYMVLEILAQNRSKSALKISTLFYISSSPALFLCDQVYRTATCVVLFSQYKLEARTLAKKKV